MKLSSFIWVGVALLVSSPCRAETDSLIEGAKLCTRYLPRYERENAIPTHLLSAIASTESGRYHEGLKLKLPWPWTINAAGKGYFFNTKEEAIAAVRRLHAEGIQSIDVGCMQVNLYHHPDAFSSLDQAFEPQTNIAYAAGFLRSLYQQEGTWKKAAADYHSKTPERGRQYVDTVYDSWFTIIERLRAARLQVPSNTETSMGEMRGHVVTSHVIHIANDTPPNAIQPAALPEQEGRQVSAYASPRMKAVSVKNSYENGDGYVTVERDTASADPIPAEPKAPDVLVITPDQSPPSSVVTPNIVATNNGKPNVVQTDAASLAALTPSAAPSPGTFSPPAVLASNQSTITTPMSPAISAVAAVAAPVVNQAVASATNAMSSPNVTPTVNPVTTPTATTAAAATTAPVQKSGPNFIFND